MKNKVISAMLLGMSATMAVPGTVEKALHLFTDEGFFYRQKKCSKKATILEIIWHIILEKINFDLDSLKGERNNGRKLFNWDGRGNQIIYSRHIKY